MNPESVDALQDAFQEFEKGEGATVAVYLSEGVPLCTGLDLKYCRAGRG